MANAITVQPMKGMVPIRFAWVRKTGMLTMYAPIRSTLGKSMATR